MLTTGAAHAAVKLLRMRFSGTSSQKNKLLSHDVHSCDAADPSRRQTTEHLDLHVTSCETETEVVCVISSCNIPNITKYNYCNIKERKEIIGGFSAE